MTSFRDLLSTTYEYKPYIRISDDFLDDFPWLHNIGQLQRKEKNEQDKFFYEDFIMNNIDSKSHIWFYFDLHQGKWPFLNGQVKNTSNL